MHLQYCMLLEVPPMVFYICWLWPMSKRFLKSVNIINGLLCAELKWSYLLRTSTGLVAECR